MYSDVLIPVAVMLLVLIAVILVITAYKMSRYSQTENVAVKDFIASQVSILGVVAGTLIVLFSLVYLVAQQLLGFLVSLLFAYISFCLAAVSPWDKRSS